MVAKKCGGSDDHRCRMPGRPRNPEVEQRLLQVALQQLAREGYSRMSLDSVAAEAGISKPAIYRRWSSKADLATAALRTIQVNEPPVDTGSAMGDLIGILQNFRQSLLRPNGISLIGTVLAEEHHTPELLRLFRQRIVTPRRQMLRAVLETAQARGQLRPAVNLDTAVNVLVGAFYAHYLADPQISPEYPAELVTLVWAGLALPSGPPRTA